MVSTLETIYGDYRQRMKLVKQIQIKSPGYIKFHTEECNRASYEMPRTNFGDLLKDYLEYIKPSDVVLLNWVNWTETWCKRYLPQNIKDNRIAIHEPSDETEFNDYEGGGKTGSAQNSSAGNKSASSNANQDQSES